MHTNRHTQFLQPLLQLFASFIRHHHAQQQLFDLQLFKQIDHTEIPLTNRDYCNGLSISKMQLFNSLHHMPPCCTLLHRNQFI